MVDDSKWDKVITAEYKKNYLDIKEIWEYREMIFTVVKKNFISKYKQTILGPIWAFIGPIVSSGIFTIIFGNIAHLSTNGIPQFLYYYLALLFWNYFSDCLSSTSFVFLQNGYLMSKVYFPRFIMPLIGVVSSLITFLIQFSLLIPLYIIFMLIGTNIHFELSILLLPIYFIQLILLSLGVGSIFASFTTKYRDLGVVISFIVGVWMYVTPIVYSSSAIPSNLYFIYHLNPVTNTIEWLIYSFYGAGNPSILFLIYSIVVSIILFVIGTSFFQKSERTFIDTI